MVDPTELTMQQVLKRYCRPRAVDIHPAIITQHLIANLLSMTEPETPNLLQLGAQCRPPYSNGTNEGNSQTAAKLDDASRQIPGQWTCPRSFWVPALGPGTRRPLRTDPNSHRLHFPAQGAATPHSKAPQTRHRDSNTGKSLGL